jgi:predicted RNase H-like nuclease (RuvC/YqgF family)
MIVLSRAPIAGAGVFALVVAVACATSPFDRYLAEERWVDAARVFTADSALLNNEHALYSAGVLYGTPGRATFDAERARVLLRRLVSRFPQSKYRNDATERLSLLDEVARVQREADARERDLTSQIDALTTETRQLRARLDSIGSQADQQRRNSTRLDAELRERDDQLRALRLELQRLKEIDLKPRPPARTIKP